MSSSDFSKPLTTDAYANFATETINNFTDLAKALDPATTTPANLPAGSIAWSSANNYWQKWNGSAWSALTATYAISISGNAATASSAAACTGNSATASSAAACTGNSATASTASALNTANNYKGNSFQASANGLNYNIRSVSGTGATWVNSFMGSDQNGFYILMSPVQTSQSAAESATISTYRPFFANASTGAVTIDGTGSGASFGGAVSITGNLTAALVTQTSDERVKTNWRDLPEGFVKKLSKLKSGIFDRTDIDGTFVGIGAQSLRRILKFAVFKGKDGKLSVDYGAAAMVSCVELAKENEALKKRLDKVEKLLARLK